MTEQYKFKMGSTSAWLEKRMLYSSPYEAYLDDNCAASDLVLFVYQGGALVLAMDCKEIMHESCTWEEFDVQVFKAVKRELIKNVKEEIECVIT